MSPAAVEYVDLVARWIHVIAGIMWVGNSLLFNWLDRTLQPPGRDAAPGSVGETWLLHSGAFYYVDKTLLGGRTIPKPVHWFFVQAFTTFWSGVVLLIAVYWAGGRAAMTDPSVADISHGVAVGVGIGAVIGGTLIYQLMNQLVAPRAPALSLAIWLGSLVAISFALTQLLSGRAAFLHVGAMLGTIMASNVARTILPSQRELVASVNEGRAASAAVSARAKRVSIHNNYFVFPVIVLMVISHFPGFYSGGLNWVVLFILVAAGAAVRHVMNIRFTFRQWAPTLAAIGIASIAALIAVKNLGRAGESSPAATHAGPVDFAEVRHVIDRRCSVCHSERPTDLSFGPMPGGVAFDTPAQISQHAGRIHERAVISKTMPPANRTGITEAERRLLAAWYLARRD